MCPGFEAAPSRARHDGTFVDRLVTTLWHEGLEIWLFGGWAEERLGLSAPREHGDIDLLCVALNFDEMDDLIERRRLRTVKRLPHKRAFEFEGVVVDLFLVQRDAAGFYSEFFALRHSWPDDVVSDRSPVPIASSASVREFPRAFRRLAQQQRSQATS